MTSQPISLFTAQQELLAKSIRIEQLEVAAAWYAVQVFDGRNHGLIGDIARAKLDRDGGHMARQALNNNGDK